MSADSDEAVLLEWNVAEGDRVHPGRSVAVVETEKAAADIEADREATVYTLLVDAGATVPAGDPIAVLVEEADDTTDKAAIYAAVGLPMAADPITSATDVTTSGSRIVGSPLARRMAREAGVALESLTGTGPGGRIVRADVEKAVAARPATTPAEIPRANSEASTPDDSARTPHSTPRRTLGSRLAASKRDAPHFYLTRTCRVDELLALRGRINEDSTVRGSINDLFIMATARSLAAVPELNVRWEDEATHHFDRVDVAVAIASEKGLVTPVVRSADRLPLTELATVTHDYMVRANAGRLKQDELTGGSFTVSNLGMYGVESFSAIINPGQTGILAVGAVTKQPVVTGDQLEIGHTVTVTLSADHRPVDGVIAARWLQHLVDLIEHPLRLLI